LTVKIQIPTLSVLISQGLQESSWESFHLDRLELGVISPFHHAMNFRRPLDRPGMAFSVLSRPQEAVTGKLRENALICAAAASHSTRETGGTSSNGTRESRVDQPEPYCPGTKTNQFNTAGMLPFALGE